MPGGFVHLHVHSEYSLTDGLIRIEPLAQAVAAAGMPAVALTEHGNLFSAVKFYRAAEEAGVKPLIGAELRLAGAGGTAGNGRVLLLCQDQTGYRNLSRLISDSYVRGQIQGVPNIRREWLAEHAAGLIAVLCAGGGDLQQALLGGNARLAGGLLEGWQAMFPERLYLELTRTGRPWEEEYLQAAVDFAAARDVPVVATNDVRFMTAADFEAHEARVCIQQGRILDDPRRPRQYSPQQYLRAPGEMRALFSDLPEAIENTLAIAERCNLELKLGAYHLPEFPVPAGYDQNSWLVEEARRGLEQEILPALARRGARAGVSPDEYRTRLERELEVITSTGFAGYFLIVADFIRWAKQQGIPVGPGRGSGAGSLVAYALGITTLDPIQYDLLFERFLNPERVSLPDFDVDFCMERRDEVIDYVANRYGHDRVSQIITHGSMAAKAVVRDVGRVLGYSYSEVDEIAKKIPFALDMTLDRALEEEETLRQRYKTEERVRDLIDLARKLEGLTRNAGRHAGGVVIAPRPLTEFMPLYCEQGSTATVTQFDMGDVEAIGLVKFDFLGLRTLTVIHRAVEVINQIRGQRGEPPLDITSIPLDDAATFDLIRSTDTAAIFQLESEGMRKLIKRLQPDTFDDLVALVALFRPGPLQSGMVDDFIDRKHGAARIQYPHPTLEPVLKPTYGVILYQEQVMQIAQILAGYTLGAADLLRRAMGKKKPEEMARHRPIFLEGAARNGVDRRTAEYIFDLMEKFAGYGFNKAHSAAYALIAYQTAWLKAHYPAAFMAAVLSSDMDHTDKVVGLCEEARRMQLNVLPPSVNTCDYAFTVASRDTIQYGLGAVKGVGRGAVEAIVAARRAGLFRDLFDFCRRLDLHKVNRRVLESLIRCGALDDLGPGRSSLMASLDKALQLAEQHARNQHSGQEDLFGLAASAGGETAAQTATAFVVVPEWTEEERLRGEKETLGFYLAGHPIMRYESELAQIITARLNDLEPGLQVTIAGYIASLRARAGRRGRMAELRLDDRTARVPVVVYAEQYQRYRELLIKDSLIIVRGQVMADEFYESGYSVTAHEIYSLQQVRDRCATLRLRVQGGRATALITALKNALQPHRPGTCTVAIEYHNGRARAGLRLGPEWRVSLSDGLLADLRSSLGPENVMIEYNLSGL
jgi:DNA polymerase-3 subunit alpha